MCEKCPNAMRKDTGYKVLYFCTIQNNILSEYVDTYFNERDYLIQCPQPTKKEKAI